MHKRIIWFACLLLAFSSASAQEPEPDRPIKRPLPAQQTEGKLPVLPEKVTRVSGKMFIQENFWDFGHVPQDVQITHRFTIENVGVDTLFIDRIKPT